MQLTWQLIFKCALSAQEGPKTLSLSLCKHSQLLLLLIILNLKMQSGEKTNLLQKCLNPPKFIVANKKEVKLEMFKSIQ